MNHQLISSLKREGARRALHDAISGRLWAAKRALEEASNDGYKSFNKSVAEALKAIGEAESIHKEWKGNK